MSQYTPLSALLVGQLAVEAGIPPGVINILPGKGAVCGDAITKHPLVDKASRAAAVSYCAAGLGWQVRVEPCWAVYMKIVMFIVILYWAPGGGMGHRSKLD